MGNRRPFNALVFGASGGIGAAVCDALTADTHCVNLLALSRSNDGIDVTDEPSLAAAAARIADGGDKFDLIFNAAGVLEVDGAAPEKAFRDISGETMRRAFEINAVGGALFLKHFLPLQPTDRRTVFATLSARVGSIGDNALGGWISYRASKAALNQTIRCAAIETKRRNSDSIVIALHPGTIETPLTQRYAHGKYTATPSEAAHNLLKVCSAATPADSGGFFDYAGLPIAW